MGPMPPMMPMLPPPPPWAFAPPPRSGGRGVVIGLLAVLLAISILFNLILFLFIGLGSGRQPGQSVQSVVTEGEAGQTVAIIPVFGVIYDNLEQQFAEDLQTAESDSDIRAVVVHIDSPGGTVTDSHQMYEALRAFRQRTGKPVVVHMDSVAASGGYFLACAANEIVAEESTITGSIGVLMSYPQLSQFAEKTGIRYQTLVADGSPKKNSLDIWEAPSDEDLADIQSLLNQQHDLFRSVVEAGRSSQLASAGTSVDAVTTGQVWLGGEAQAMGLVDKVGFIEDAITAAAGLAGLNNPQVVRYTREPSLAEALGLVSSPVDGLKVDVGALESADLKRAAGQLIHELSTPHSLYLYRGVQ